MVMITEQISTPRIRFAGKRYSSEKWVTFSNPINAQGEMVAIRIIWRKGSFPAYMGA